MQLRTGWVTSRPPPGYPTDRDGTISARTDGISRVTNPAKKFSFSPYNISFIDQACLVKTAINWPRSQKRTWPISSYLDFTLEQCLINNAYQELIFTYYPVIIVQVSNLCHEGVTKGALLILRRYFDLCLVFNTVRIYIKMS